MSSIRGFTPIANKNAKILVLGSMPSDVSLQEQEYYAHQRNAFWPIMFSICNESSDRHEYWMRKQMLMENKIAVWDVLQSCYREGSLDTAIKMNSIKVNNFHQFLTKHTGITKVCFNGAKAEAVYVKYVLPVIKEHFGDLEYARLPSTSPAHAALTLQQKIRAWQKEINGLRI